MKEKAAVAGVIIVALGLGAALLFVNHTAQKERQAAQVRVGSLSNQLASAQANLQEQQQVNLALSSNLAATTVSYSNQLAGTEASLHATQAGLDQARADAKAAADDSARQLAQRDKKIADLEHQNADLDRQSIELHASITNLEQQINETKNKLASSEGDRTFLLGELKRLQGEKADLEKKFNDLASVKQQLHNLREEMAVARRLDWMHRGLYTMDHEKGAERLMRQPEQLARNKPPGLDVELRTNAPAKIIEETNGLPPEPPGK